MMTLPKLTNATAGREVFTLDEGQQVTISFPENLSSASLRDLKDYLDIFYRKASRLSDDPHDAVDPDNISRSAELSRAA